jgi:hypothetical protein
MDDVSELTEIKAIVTETRDRVTRIEAHMEHGATTMRDHETRLRGIETSERSANRLSALISAIVAGMIAAGSWAVSALGGGK